MPPITPAKTPKGEVALTPKSQKAASEKKTGGKSATVLAVEAMEKKREDRRLAAQANKESTEQESKDNEEIGIENIKFMRMINQYRAKNGVDHDIGPVVGNFWANNDCKICVAIRVRPLLPKEKAKHDFMVTSCKSHNSLTLHEPKVKVDMTKYMDNHQFFFDVCFNHNTKNEQIYITIMQPLIQFVFDKGKATIFCYGQTGSGKTCTMMGHGNPDDKGNMIGLYAMAAMDLFRMQYSDEYGDLGLLVYASHYEIYKGKVYDLFNNNAPLDMLEDAKGNIVIQGLLEKQVTDAQEIMTLLAGAKRATASTNMNSESSRSHAILHIILREPTSKRQHGKLSMIDLAGSERAADSNEKDDNRRQEGAEINKSLLCLKECIRAMEKEGHTPFRGSKLTQVLKDSFTGTNSRTVMVGNVSPSNRSVEHTLNALRYAYRVKEMSGKSAKGADLAPVDMGNFFAGAVEITNLLEGEVEGAEKMDMNVSNLMEEGQTHPEHQELAMEDLTPPPSPKQASRAAPPPVKAAPIAKAAPTVAVAAQQPSMQLEVEAMDGPSVGMSSGSATPTALSLDSSALGESSEKDLLARHISVLQKHKTLLWEEEYLLACAQQDEGSIPVYKERLQQILQQKISIDKELWMHVT